MTNKIYQCYFKPEQKYNLFKESCYEGFGLEPSCNDKLFLNCPELEIPKNRLGLTEYACFLWFYRNQEHLGDWFGTTSYRQLDKTKFKFNSIKQIESSLEGFDVVTWHHPLMIAKLRVGAIIPISLRMHTDLCHPGLNAYLEYMFNNYNHDIPKGWYEDSTGVFANYWVMRKEDFISYMDFSWPMVEDALSNIESSMYYKQQHEFGTVSKEKCVGYFMERLFTIWVMLSNKKVNYLVEPQGIIHAV